MIITETLPVNNELPSLVTVEQTDSMDVPLNSISSYLFGVDNKSVLRWWLNGTEMRNAF